MNFKANRVIVSENAPLQLGPLTLTSRLIVGSGRYESLELMRQCHQAAQTQMVTVALRRMQIAHSSQNHIADFIDTDVITLLPNTAGCQNARETLRVAKMARAMGSSHLKIEVINENKTLLPDAVETLKAVELIRQDPQLDDLFLMVYSNDDPILAKKLYEAKANCIMPLASPIGSGRGLQNIYNLLLIKELLPKGVPIIIDAGIGSPSDACKAMELGFDAVLLNTAIALAREPVAMAKAFAWAVAAGRAAFESGIIERKLYASASSPIKDF